MNKVILKGNLTRDPEVKVVNANGRDTSVANFTVAVNRFYKQKNGEMGKDTVFVPCECWDKNAEIAGQYLVKGAPVLVDGSLKVDAWEAEDGSKRSRILVRVGNFDMLGKRPTEDKATNEPASSDDDPSDETSF